MPGLAWPSTTTCLHWTDGLDLVSLCQRWATPPGPPATAGHPPFLSPLPLTIPFTFLHLHRAVYFVQLRVLRSLPHSFNQAYSVSVRFFVQFLRFRSLYSHDYRQSPVRCVCPNLLLWFDVLCWRNQSIDRWRQPFLACCSSGRDLMRTDHY